MDNLEKLRKDKSQLKGRHGGDIYSAKEKLPGATLLDFSANLNPLGLPEGIKKALLDNWDDYAAYPDPFCRELVGELSSFEGVSQEHILCGNGAADLIFRLVYAAEPKRALVLAPSFLEYEEALQQVACEVVYYELKKDLLFQLDGGIADALTADLDMVFLCNPNNPTGQVVTKDILLPLISYCEERGIILVVDECFNGFLEDEDAYSVKEYVDEFSCLVVLRALTKSFAMAGFRLGYCFMRDEHLLNRVRAAGQPWSVSIVAQVAGLQALKEIEYLQKTKELIKEERAFLLESLSALGISFVSSGANYVFFQWPLQERVALDEALFKRAILIRNCDNYPGLESGYYRICIKRHEENKKLIEAIEQIIEQVNQ